jgi:phosphoribosylformylglycinamidine synthase I
VSGERWPRVAVVVFPGSNCDRDALWALRDLTVPAEPVWHADADLEGFEAVLLPGGFSYGDYLRAGALAARSPVMTAVRRLVRRGGRVLGICNGFQILCEAGLLPGALTLNVSRRFHCQWTPLAAPPGNPLWPEGARLRLPIAHGEGCYRLGPDGRAALADGAYRIWLQYCGPDGSLDAGWAPNGSDDNIAGIATADGRVAGLMPHPERAMEDALGGRDGRRVLTAWLAGGRGAW